ncbi:MAG: aminotransferase class V-fold PLP-dependent enzyme [Bacteroidota bacterium]
MQTARRSFLKQSLKVAATVPALNLAFFDEVKAASLTLVGKTDKQIASDESFWYQVQKAYTVSPHFINLENGYFSLAADEVLEAQLKNIRMINEKPSWYMRKKQWEDRAAIKKQLADFAGVTVEEIALLRNTTEALNIVIQGINMDRGDEAIMSTQDYGSMLEAFEYRSKRFGTVNKKIDLPLHPKNDDEIVTLFEKEISSRTKVILVTHMINLTGQILPVRKIAEMAHSKGVEVISDSAHAFAHIKFKIPDLACDYLGTSLHKWLGTPLGLGMLYVKKEKIPNVWPLIGDIHFADDDIRKFEHIGTHPCSADLAIANALRFHELIGSNRKEQRLRYLKSYWMEKAANLPHIIVNTPKASSRSCAIGNVGVEGISPSKLADILYEKYRVFTVAINHKDIKGVRVTPHLYTTIKDLDVFVNALEEISSEI